MERAARGAVLGLLGLSILILAFAVGYVARGDGGGSTSPPAQTSSGEDTPAIDFAALNEMLRELQRNYVDPDRIDAQTLYEAAIRGMLGTLSDSGTYYVDPITLKIRPNLTGSFDGIGASVRGQEGQIVIVAPIKDTPAERAGIRSGDIVLEVDGVSTEGWTEERAIFTIRGEKGTQVTIKVRHTDGTEATFEIVRDAIPQVAVTDIPPGGVLEDGTGTQITDIAYLQLGLFTEPSQQELSDAIEAALAAGKKGLILDLRNNPGGLLDTTLGIADMFLDEGVILTERDRGGDELAYRAKRGGVATQIPLVILQNRFSASASEVLGAALHDNGRATLVGEKTFGKGTVNVPQALGDGGELYITVARWLTPNGTQIDGIGVSPDVEVELTDEDIDLRRDRQLHKAIDILRGTSTTVESAPNPTATTGDATPAAGG